ncbi:MAG: hypothetical protein DHS20C02_19980 [Micavibrio sp.]|nr:MAG: hypothetical protein DHS20C02_19980 [Micavibrio sp.]
MTRYLYLIFLIGVVLAPGIGVAQEGRSSTPNYQHDSRSYIHNPKYQGMVRRALKYQPEDFRFGKFRMHYKNTTWYDPVADKLREEMLAHAFTILYSEDSVAIRDAKEKYKQIVSDHMANVGVVIEALALAREDKRFGDTEFFRWMSSGLMQVVLKSGDGRSLRGAYNVNTLDEETLLIHHLNLKLIKTDARHSSRIYYNMHLVRDLISGEEFTLFVDVTHPFAKIEEDAKEPNYAIKILRQ